MTKEKRERQYVFSARTTEEGLNALNDLKARLGVGWDTLVIDAVCAHYGLDRATLALPPKVGQKAKGEAEPNTETGAPKPRRKAKKDTAGETAQPTEPGSAIDARTDATSAGSESEETGQ